PQTGRTGAATGSLRTGRVRCRCARLLGVRVLRIGGAVLRIGRVVLGVVLVGRVVGSLRGGVVGLGIDDHGLGVVRIDSILGRRVVVGDRPLVLIPIGVLGVCRAVGARLGAP